MNKTDKIAMKISQEEFNEIFHILKDKQLIYKKHWSTNNCYIVNKDCDCDNVCLYGRSAFDKERTILPYNKKLFLKYCGIETEETFEEYTKRVNPSLFSNFLAEKELRNRKPVCKTHDGIDLYIDDEYFTIEIDYCDTHWKIVKYILRTTPNSDLQFSTKELAEKYISDKRLLLKTDDGFDIFKGDVFYLVQKETFDVIGRATKKYDIEDWVSFKEKVNMQNYILLNKKTLSIKDLDIIVGSGNEKLELINKVKRELGFN